MSIKKKLFIGICSIVVILLCAGSGFAQTVTWKVGYGGAPNDPNDKLLQAFGQKLDEASGGRFKLKIVMTAPLGYGNNQILRFLKQGLADAGIVIPNYLYKDEPLIGVMLPAGVLLDQEDNEKLFPVMREALDKIYGKWGVELRGPVIPAIMVDWTLISKEPINSLEQLKGVKIRHSDKIPIKALNKLGVPAQFVDVNETYMALKTGVIDGAAASRLWTLQASYYEVTKYFSQLYPHSTAVMPGIAVTKKSWAKLPDDLKDVWEATAKSFLWDAMYSAWKAKTYEINSAKGLKEKGMVELDGFSREDRITIQKTTLEEWLTECKRLGPEAVEHYNKVVPLIPKE